MSPSLDIANGHPAATNGVKAAAHSTTPSAKPSSTSTSSTPISLTINNLHINGFISPSSHVANFLNLPYARIPARFRQAVPVDLHSTHGILNATAYGPRCPQPFDTLHEMTAHLYPHMATRAPTSEFECLNLNIYTPPGAVGGEDALLPVLVWIHGGAFTYGDGTCEFDGNFLVQHAVAVGKPMVVVSLNYRLGYFGFITSQELREEAQRNGEVGYSNLGFHDQRVGLQWIQTNIHLFGGSPTAITVAGESAGGCSILAHAASTVPLFQRAFIMSAASLSPAPLSAAQSTFDRLVASTGVRASAPGPTKIDALRSLSPLQLEHLLQGEHVSPIWDPAWFAHADPAAWLGASTALPAWVSAVVVGSTRDECALFAQPWRTLSTVGVIAAIREACEAEADGGAYADTILAAYDITPSHPAAAAIKALEAWTTDALFGALPYTLSASAPTAPARVAIYAFEQPDPHPGPWAGAAYHSLDNAFLFRLPSVAGPHAPPDLRASADVFSEACIRLVNGELPWEAYGEKGRVMRVRGEESGVVDGREVQRRWEGVVGTGEKAGEGLGVFAERGRRVLFAAMKTAMRQPLE